MLCEVKVDVEAIITDLILLVRNRGYAISKEINDYVSEVNTKLPDANYTELIGFESQLVSMKEKVNSMKVSVEDVAITKSIELAILEKVKGTVSSNEANIEMSKKHLEDVYKEEQDKVIALNKATMEKYYEKYELYDYVELLRNNLLELEGNIDKRLEGLNIKSKAIAIDTDSFTIGELKILYKEYYNYFSDRESGIGKYVDRLRNVVEKVESFRGSHQWSNIIILTVLGLTVRAVLPVVAVVVYVVIIDRSLNSVRKTNNAIVAKALLNNVSPLDKAPEKPIDLLLPEEFSPDTNDRVEEAFNSVKKAIEDAKEFELKVESTIDEMKVKALESGRTKSKIRKLESDITESKERTSKRVDETLELVLAKQEYLRTHISKIGDKFNTSAVMSFKNLVGYSENHDNVYVEFKPLMNLVIKETPNIKNTLRVLLCNVYTNVRLGKLQVVVVDTNQRGSELVPIYTEKLDPYFKITREPAEKVITDMQELADKNNLKLAGSDILEYNINAEELGKITMPYKLVILRSGFEKMLKKEPFLNFLEFSYKLGIIIWVVTNETINRDNIERLDNSSSIAKKEIVMSNEDLAEFSGRVEEELAELKPAPFAWEKLDKVVNGDEWWKDTPDTFIKFYPGFCEGDPFKANVFTLGHEGAVHALTAGTTGAGKSVYLNTQIANMTKRYSPNKLELWLIDFKAVEFGFYMRSEEFPYQLPHIKACVTTKDGAFAESVFRKLSGISTDRTALFTEQNVKNLPEYNRKMVRLGMPDKQLRRILVVADEFQEMFSGESESIETIKSYITSISKVGRAQGIHFYFTSQSMTGTVSDDVLQQFSLRMVLRCDEEVSQSLLGVKSAGQIADKFGYIYVKSIEHIKPEQVKIYTTPYISENALKEHIKECEERSKEEEYFIPHEVIEYSEKDVHPLSTITDIRAKARRLMQEDTEDTIFLGEYMILHDGKYPKNITLTEDKDSHLLAAFSNTVDYYNFIQSIYVNVYSSNNIIPICNFSSRRDSYLSYFDEYCDVEEDKVQKTLQYSSVNGIVKFANSLMERMDKEGNVPKKNYVFVCVGWESDDVFLEEDYDTIDELKDVLSRGPEHNVHFLLISQRPSFKESLVNNFGFRICGLVSENIALTVQDVATASKVKSDMSSGYMYVKTLKSNDRVKIYQSDKEGRTVKSNEL